MIIEELVAKLGISIDANKWNAALKSLGDLKKSFKSFALFITGASAGLVYFESKLSKMAFSLKNQSQILQLSTKKIQALRLAAKEAGTPFTGVTSAISQLQAALANFRSGLGFPANLQKGLALLSRFSHRTINVERLKNGEQLFRQISISLSRIKNTQLKEGALNQLFGNSDLLPLIGNGLNKINAAFNQLKNRKLFYSKDELKRATEFGMQLSVISAELKKQALVLGISLLPAINKLSKEFLNITKNKEFIQGLDDIAKAIEYIAITAAKSVEGIGRLIKAFDDIEGIVSGRYKIDWGPLKNISWKDSSNIHNNNVSNQNNTSHTTNNHFINYSNYGLAFTTSHVTGNFR